MDGCPPDPGGLSLPLQLRSALQRWSFPGPLRAQPGPCRGRHLRGGGPPVPEDRRRSRPGVVAGAGCRLGAQAQGTHARRRRPARRPKARLGLDRRPSLFGSGCGAMGGRGDRLDGRQGGWRAQAAAAARATTGARLSAASHGTTGMSCAGAWAPGSRCGTCQRTPIATAKRMRHDAAEGTQDDAFPTDSRPTRRRL
jgi:hypothetical protein